MDENICRLPFPSPLLILLPCLRFWIEILMYRDTAGFYGYCTAPILIPWFYKVEAMFYRRDTECHLILWFQSQL